MHRRRCQRSSCPQHLQHPQLPLVLLSLLLFVALLLVSLCVLCVRSPVTHRRPLEPKSRC